MITNPLSQHKTDSEKISAYKQDIAKGALAYNDKLETFQLETLSPDDVEFIGGAWRVQNKRKAKIVHVRDRDLIIGRRLPHQENTFFEYYVARAPVYNCYGMIFIDKWDIIVAKYETSDGTQWGYGPTIEAARAFLGIRLYDKYKDLIHIAVGKNANNHNARKK